MDLKKTGRRSSYGGENCRSVSFYPISVLFFSHLKKILLIQVESFTSNKRRLMVNLFTQMMIAVLFLNKKKNLKRKN